MKPARFSYRVASSVEEAIVLRAQGGGDAVFLAGGQSLVPMMNLRLVRPEAVIDINRIEELSYIREVEGGVEIGALTRYREVERSETAFRLCPLLRETIGNIAHRVIRNRGTVGGSIANAHPASELPATLLALGGCVIVRGMGGERRIAADDFFISPFVTSLGDDEIVVGLFFPTIESGGYAFREFSRRHGDFAIAAVSAVLGSGGMRLAVAGVGDRPLLVETDDPQAAAAACDPPDDMYGTAEYRRELVCALAAEAIGTARARAAGVR